MTPADIRAYQRQLVLFCLGIHGECTAGEVLELAGNAALDANAPRETLLLTAAATAGLLREMDGEGLVSRGDNRASGRDGRSVATWNVTDAGRITGLPVPPVAEPALPLSPASALQIAAPPNLPAGVPLPQVLALLASELDCLLGQLERDHQAAQQRARNEFEVFRERALRMWAVSGSTA
ncbi:hypothetical protein [uncultured Stenotrophomonas sp.]|uniref:hypothetical protein n=1 Tax=uncultured Stenotrophomonas sp. TaxID=165438 RepID=UPI0025EFBAC3|nr:hypothetical protein [uncultured Stenotrophomonas sp.]